MRFILLISCLLSAGCARLLAEQMVRAPNRNDSPANRADAPAADLKKLYVDHQLRVPVGPPDASLSVWVFEPYSGKETLDFTGFGRRMGANLHRDSHTQLAHPIDAKATVFVLNGIEDDKTLGPYVLYR